MQERGAFLEAWKYSTHLIKPTKQDFFGMLSDSVQASKAATTTPTQNQGDVSSQKVDTCKCFRHRWRRIFATSTISYNFRCFFSGCGLKVIYHYHALVLYNSTRSIHVMNPTKLLIAPVKLGSLGRAKPTTTPSHLIPKEVDRSQGDQRAGATTAQTHLTKEWRSAVPQ